MSAAKREARRGAVVRFAENAFVRTEPSAAGVALGVVKRGAELPYGGCTAPGGWLKVRYFGMAGWVSGRFSFVVMEAME